ncbi:MAG: response regulator [Pseudomonadota bacterium]
MKNGLHQSKIRALVVADSPFMGMQLAEILNGDDALEVIGRAANSIEALRMVKELRPDVAAMDVDVHNTDGITVLKHIMLKHPLPIVVIGSFANEASELAFDALRFGAVDVIGKPFIQKNSSPESQRALVVAVVKSAAAMRVDGIASCRDTVSAAGARKTAGGIPDPHTRYVCITALTNGYYCFLRIVPTLPADFADILIGTIPAPPRSVDAYVQYLDRNSSVRVRNLRTAGSVEKGTCYLCSGRSAPVLEGDGKGGIRFQFHDFPESDEPLDNCDRLMASLARLAGPRAVGLAIGSGGLEGFEGTGEIRRAGGIGMVRDITEWEGPSLLNEILSWNPSVMLPSDPILQKGGGIPHHQDRMDLDGHTVAEDASYDFVSETHEKGAYVNGIDIVDYFRFVLLTGRPTVLEVFTDKGVAGRIYVRNGRVLHAQYGELQGDQALYRCLASQGGSFLNRPWREPMRFSINKPGGLVLAEAALRRDAPHGEWALAVK